MRPITSFFLQLCIVLVAVPTFGQPDPHAKSDVVNLTARNFRQFVGHGHAALVVFQTPWCGHCKRMAPDYERLATATKDQNSVLIGKVDCDREPSLCVEFEIRAYPAVKWFPSSSLVNENYHGPLTYKALSRYVNEKFGADVAEEEDHLVVDLDDMTFDRTVMNGSTHVMVKFYAYWCEASKAFAKTYHTLAEIFHPEPHVVIAQLDAKLNERIGRRYNITTFPTLLWFSRQDKRGHLYSGGTTSLSDLLAFINSKAGTHRTLLSEQNQAVGGAPQREIR